MSFYISVVDKTLLENLIPLFIFQINSELIRQQKIMEQQNHSAVVVWTHARYTANKLVKLTKTFKSNSLCV